MRKLLILLGILVFTMTASFAAKIPDDVRGYIEQEVPNSEIRFDGVIIFPSNTVYLPLFPSLFSATKGLAIKQTYPAGKSLLQDPDVIILNNDFVLTLLGYSAFLAVLLVAHPTKGISPIAVALYPLAVSKVLSS